MGIPSRCLSSYLAHTVLTRQQNEEEVGKALKDSGIPRTDVWLTSKVRVLIHQVIVCLMMLYL